MILASSYCHTTSNIHRKKKSDGFIGRLFYPLRSIPNSGEEKTLAIYDRPQKKSCGYVALGLSVGVKKKKTPLEVSGVNIMEQ